MDLEELDTVVIFVDNKPMGNGSAQYNQRASQKDLSILWRNLSQLCATGAARFHPGLTVSRDLWRSYYRSLWIWNIFSPSPYENPVLNLSIDERNYPCLIDTGAISSTLNQYTYSSRLPIPLCIYWGRGTREHGQGSFRALLRPPLFFLQILIEDLRDVVFKNNG